MRQSLTTLVYALCVSPSSFACKTMVLTRLLASLHASWPTQTLSRGVSSDAGVTACVGKPSCLANRENNFNILSVGPNPVDNFLEGVRTGSSVSLSCEGYFVNDLTEPFDSFLDGFRTGGSVSVSCDGYFVNDLTDPCDTPEPCLARDSDGVDFKESF